MPDKPQKYVKKPVEVEALRIVDSAAMDSASDWIKANGGKCAIRRAEDPKDDVLIISTLEGPITASMSDYIVKGIHGEFYPVKPDIFNLTYDEVDYKKYAIRVTYADGKPHLFGPYNSRDSADNTLKSRWVPSDVKGHSQAVEDIVKAEVVVLSGDVECDSRGYELLGKRFREVNHA